MKKFLVKTGVFLLVLTISIYLYIFLLANNATDPYYYRYTTGKYKSLVLGTSRAAQGIEPGILNESLHLDDNRLFNYSFTVNRTQWGEPYHNSIVRKLDTLNNRNGVFILECNLWAFCSKKNELGSFREQNAAPNNMRYPTLKPNIEYFFGGYEQLNAVLLVKPLLVKKRHSYVNENGRLVVPTKFDSAKISDLVKRKAVTYERMTRQYVRDTLRMRSFINTINFLKRFGSVYLIRMPVAEEMLEIESAFYPEFNSQITEVSKQLEVPYLDFSYLSSKYITHDGNHIHNQYVDTFNKLLASEIVRSGTRSVVLSGEQGSPDSIPR